MPKPVENPPNPWLMERIEWLGELPHTELQVYEEQARSILSKNDSSDLAFRYSINPYRGCYHACAYCYARQYHEYLGWGAGTDFDRKIVVKTNAAALLRKAFLKRSWVKETLVFSGATDCYQPLEAAYQITRQCLEVCVEFKNPVGIITKSPLVQRDVDLLAKLAADAEVRVFMSIAFLDDELAKKVEPSASRITQRFDAMAALSRAGVPTGLALAPVIPGLNDVDVPKLLEHAHKAGADTAFMTLLRLPGPVEEVFQTRMSEVVPLRTRKIQHQTQAARARQKDSTAFGSRMMGQGPRWDVIQCLFQTTARRLGINTQRSRVLQEDKPPVRTPQLSLFE